MSQKRRRQLWEYLTPEQHHVPGPKVTVLPTPRPHRRTSLDVVLELYAKPPGRNIAIERLVVTFPAERQAWVRERWQARTLGGTLVKDADPAELALEAVALAGWALDRQYEKQHRHWQNLGAWHWVEAARAAIAELERLAAV